MYICLFWNDFRITEKLKTLWRVLNPASLNTNILYIHGELAKTKTINMM